MLAFLLFCPSGPSYSATPQGQRPDPTALTAVRAELTTKDTRPNFTDEVVKLRNWQAVEAQKAREAAEAARRAYLADLARTAALVAPEGTYANSYAWGQCTWYVASRIKVPNYLGNANAWYGGLKALGWREGAPRVGAIGVSFEGYYGHVVIVEQVNGDGTVVISEMNYAGAVGVSDRRLTASSDFVYLYP